MYQIVLWGHVVLRGGTGPSDFVHGVFRSPVRSCAEPSMSFTSKLPPISASCAASGNMWPSIRNFMARVSVQWRSLLVWWASSYPISLEGRAGSRDGESSDAPSFKNPTISTTMYLLNIL